MSNEKGKRGVGRPRMETYLNPAWYDMIIESGRNGQHITDFLIKLGISWEGHYDLIKRNKKYSEAVQEYKKLAEDYWYNLAKNSMDADGGVGFNSRLWALVMKNKFGNNWKDERQVDVTTQGEKISDIKPIQIEIIKKQSDGEAN